RAEAELLERALDMEQAEDLRRRYAWELANAWVEGGEKSKALAAYLKRLELGGSNQEQFVTLRRIGQLKEDLGHPDAEIIGTYLKVFEICFAWAESLYDAARYCRATRNFRQAYMMAKQGLQLPTPRRGFHLAPWIYDYGLL